MRAPHTCTGCWSALNESPSQKEGKWSHRRDHYVPQWRRLNESLHLKVLNKQSCGHLEGILICLIESPYKTVGKFLHRRNTLMILLHASIKVPPHRREQLIIYTWRRSSPVEWCNRFVSFGLGYALSWSGVSSCWVGCGVSRDLVRMSRLR